MRKEEPLYLDYAATTPVDPRVLDEMLPYFTEHYGNPASHHTHGEYAERAVDIAKEQFAGLVNTEADDEIRKKYLHRSIKEHIFRNPVRYFNC